MSDLPHNRRRHTRLTGIDRTTTARTAARLYYNGASVRTIAAQIGCSYGLTHTLLREEGVRLRARGKESWNASR